MGSLLQAVANVLDKDKPGKTISIAMRSKIRSMLFIHFSLQICPYFEAFFYFFFQRPTQYGNVFLLFKVDSLNWFYACGFSALSWVLSDLYHSHGAVFFNIPNFFQWNMGKSVGEFQVRLPLFQGIWTFAHFSFRTQHNDHAHN